MLHWLKMLCIWLDIDSDTEPYTLKELHSKMSELVGDGSVYCLKRLKQKLQERYGDNLYFAETEGKSNVACFQNMIDYYLNDLWKEKRRKGKEKDAERIVMTASKVIMAEIREKKYDTSTNPKTTDIRNTTGDWKPKLLKAFLQVLARSDLRQNSISQALVQAAKPSSAIMPVPFGLAVELDHGSRWLLDELYQLGFCSSYTEVTRFKQSVMVMEDATHTDVVLPPGTFSQNIADNVDHNLCTLDQKTLSMGWGSFKSHLIITVYFMKKKQ